MKAAPIIVISMLLIVLSCNKSVEPPTVAHYTLTAGDNWSYAVTAKVTNIRVHQPGVIIGDTALQWSSQAFCEGPDTLTGGIPTIRFRTAESNGLAGRMYYRTIADTLYVVATAGSPEPLPKRASLRYQLEGRTFASLPQLLWALTTDGAAGGSQAVDSIAVEQWPPKALVFPLRTGLTWAFRERGYPLWPIQKKVTGTEEVTAAGTSYPCYIIEWFWDMNSDGIWDTNITQRDDLHSNGLIRRSTTLKDVNITTAENPDGIATADITVEYVLTSTNVH